SYASGAAITVKVSVEDASGNVVTTDTSTVTLSLSGGTVGATLGGTKSVAAVAGVATFSNLTVDKVGSGYTLGATDSTLTAASSSAFKITAGAATSLTLTTQPTLHQNIGAGATIAFVAHVQDAAGNPVSGNNIQLAIGANPGGSTLSVTASPINTDSSGNASFAGVSLNKLGTGYTLVATDNTTPLNATSNAFNIIAGTPTTITLTAQPATNANIAIGATIPITAHVADGSGNPVASQNVQLTIGTNPGGASLAVTTNPVNTDGSGNATFSGVSLDKLGTGYTLVATDNTTPLNVTSNSFNIVAGAPAQLLFLQQPTSGTAGVALTPAVTVEVLDAHGFLVTADGNSVTMSVVAGPGAFDPGTVATATFNNGIATFDSLIFDVPGSTYQLKAVDNGDGLNVLSGIFSIAAGAQRLVFTTEPANIPRGGELGTIGVTEEDGSGNTVSDNGTVDFTIVACGSNLDLGSVPMTNGVATLTSSQAFYTLASGLTISATTGTYTGTSRGFSVLASADFLFSDGYEGCRP